MIESTNEEITCGQAFNSTKEDSYSNTLKSCADELSGESSIPGRSQIYDFMINISIKCTLVYLGMNNFNITSFDFILLHFVLIYLNNVDYTWNILFQEFTIYLFKKYHSYLIFKCKISLINIFILFYFDLCRYISILLILLQYILTVVAMHRMSFQYKY